MNEEHHSEPVEKEYPVGRGYGHDYMRGGEVFGGYGYSEREEYEMPRGALPTTRDDPDDDKGTGD
jgi:hypothetical protein